VIIPARLSILLALALPGAAVAQDDAVADAPVTIESDDTEAFESAFERFSSRMEELNKDVRGIVDQREREERDKVVRAYKAVQDQLEAEELDLRTVAIKRFEEFLSKYPGADYTPHVIFRLGELYFEQSGEDWLDAQRAYSSLEAEVDAGARKLEDLPPPPMKDYTNSIELYERIIYEYPGYEYADAAYYMLGYCHFDDLSEQIDLDMAKDWFQGLIDNHPRSDFAVEANLLLGTVYFDDNDIEESIPYFEAVVAAGEEHSRYDKGLYQLAWAHYKLSHYEKSLELFTGLLDFSEEQFDRTGKLSNMKPEALKYLAISFSDVADRDGDDPIAVAQRWFVKVGDREYEADVIKELAEVLVIQARYQDAIATYEHIQDKWPLDPDNPIYQNKISQLYGQLPLPDYEAGARASALLAERYGPETAWWEANRNNPDAQAAARKFIEDSLSQVARSKHQNAIMTGEAADYLDAAEHYKEYLRKFPFAGDYYEVTWYLADTLYRAGDFQQAITHYNQLLKFANKHPYTDGARYQLWKSWRQQLQATYADIYELPGDAVVERTVETVGGGQRSVYMLSEGHKGYIEISDDLRTRKFTDEVYSQALERDRAALYYDPAYILYQHGRYEDARPRFEEIINLFPQREEAEFAAGAIVNSYQEDGDLAMVMQKARLYSAMTLGPPDQPDDGVLDGVAEGAEFKLALALSNQGEFLQAAEAFIAFMETNGNSQFYNDALYNTAYNYQQAGKNDEANSYYETYINRFPTDDRSKSLYFRIASNYSSILELNKAVEYYERLYATFPDYIDSPSALYNAAFLRVGLGDFRGAAQKYEQYAASSEDAKERETVTWLAGEQWERVSEADALRFYQNYLTRYTANGVDYVNADHVMAALDWIAEYQKDKGQDRAAEATYERMLKTFDKLAEEGNVGPRARNIAAAAAFRPIWDEYEEFIEIKFTADENANTKLLIETKATALVDLVDHGRQFIQKYLDFEYTSAILYIEGAAHLAYAEMFFNAPVPENWTQDQVDYYRSILDDKARPLEDKGLARLEANLEKAAAEKRSSEWIDKTIAKLNAFRPRDWPLEKQEVRETMDSALFPTAGPRSSSGSLSKSSAGAEPAAPEPAAPAATEPDANAPAEQEAPEGAPAEGAQE
jgi:tetratricopeptide (TPR) repeat protein